MTAPAKRACTRGPRGVCGHPVVDGFLTPSPWLSDLWSCGRHLTAEERARREGNAAGLAAISALLRQRDPACSSWPMPDDLDRSDHWTALADWQDGRCGICGSTRGRQVLDHDHDTGLVRGWLCLSDNISEGTSSGAPGDVFERYRERPPAVILGVTIRYTGIGWRGGVRIEGALSVP